MELEQRMKLLEQEVKILKNEIQATLLDIQEQLLSAHHPALRAEETSPAVLSVADENEQPTRVAAPAPAVIKKVSLTSPSVPDQVQEVQSVLPGDGARPSTRKVGEPPAKEANPTGTLPLGKTLAKEPGPPTASSAVDWEMLGRLTHWTIYTVEKFGFERTRQLITIYYQQKLLSEDAAKALVQIAATAKPNGARPEKAPVEPVVAPPSAQETPAVKKDEKRNVITRIIRRLVLPNARQESLHG